MTEKAVRVLGMKALSGQHLENFSHAFVVDLKSCSCSPLLPPHKGPAAVRLDLERFLGELHC